VKRLVRAVEVHEKTGKPISELQREWAAAPREPYVTVGLRRDPVDLRRRIDRRVERMVAAGLVDEVRALAPPGRVGPTAAEMIGVKELLPALRRELETGERDVTAIEEAVRQIKQHTWVFARRQGTWWKAFPGVRWLDVPADEPAAVTGERVVAAFG
jgi:tRNA dimethylallyltransferase